jgi:riboflavin biosynthesis pyrimidine reductase
MLLGPGTGELTPDDVVAAYPWPDGRRWVRAMMVATLDGAAVGPDGLSGSISGEADKLVFDAVRREADVVLVGAGTMRAERYGPFRGRPRIAIASRSLDLPWDEPLFTESAQRPIILTTPDADPERVEAAGETCDVLTVEGETPGAYVVALEQLGLLRIVCEGGPSLLGGLVEAGLVDEADITVSPTMTGNAHTPQVPTLGDVATFDLVQVLTADGFLMGRYVRPGA